MPIFRYDILKFPLNSSFISIIFLHHVGQNDLFFKKYVLNTYLKNVLNTFLLTICIDGNNNKNFIKFKVQPVQKTFDTIAQIVEVSSYNAGIKVKGSN